MSPHHMIYLAYISLWPDRTLVKSAYQKFNFLFSQRKHIMLVLKRTASIRRFFWAPKTYVKTDGSENITHFTLKYFVYLNLWTIKIRARSPKHNQVFIMLIRTNLVPINPLIHESLCIKNNFKHSSRKHYVHEKSLKESRTNLIRTIQEHIMFQKSLWKSQEQI